MSWPTFIITAIVIGFTITDLIMYRINPNSIWLSIWLRDTILGNPFIAFAGFFVAGSFLGYMEPKIMYARYDLSEHTANLCTTLIVFVCLYDIMAVYFGGVNSSISSWMQTTAFHCPVSTAGAGFLCGHFFGYIKR